MSFEEVMQKAVELEVDMVLLGGDLFHDNKPSRATVGLGPDARASSQPLSPRSMVWHPP